LIDESERDDATRDSFLDMQRQIVRACISLSREEPARADAILNTANTEGVRADILGEAIATRALAEACCDRHAAAEESLRAAQTLVTDLRGQVMISCTQAIIVLGSNPSLASQQLEDLATTILRTGCFDSAICAMRAAPGLLMAAAQDDAMKRVVAIAASRSGDAALAAAIGAPPTPRLTTRLSTREQEVLQFAAEGFHNHEIAERLFISPKTVKTHLQNIYKKLDVASRTEAAMKAKEAGLLG
jgi:ATP/maltotriose-dependent transcriptional regulator MalT